MPYKIFHINCVLAKNLDKTINAYDYYYIKFLYDYKGRFSLITIYAILLIDVYNFIDLLWQLSTAVFERLYLL